MAGNTVESSPHSFFNNALLFIEQYGPATTGELADDQRMPLLEMRGYMKSMAALGFVEEIGYRWHLTSLPRAPETISQSLHSIMKKHEGQWAHQIAKSAGVDVSFLKSWLNGEGRQCFSEDKFNRWYSSAANGNEQPGDDSRVDVQARFISAPLDRDLVVMAPPGTGKTHALVQRLGWMSQQLPEPRQMASICVLSFTNNAVNEITSRLSTMTESAESNDSVRYINVRTFDSFATRCLADAGLPLKGDYDKNIIAFTEYLISGHKKSDVIPRLLASIRWLFVDEVQDLFGERAQLVFALAVFLKREEVRFAFLGDRHQGIYNHKTTSDQAENFLQMQQIILKGRVPLRFSFKTNYRYHDLEFALFMERARSILDTEEGHLKQFQSMEQLIPSLDIEALGDWLHGGQVAILAGRNETVARIATMLKIHGLPFTIEEGSSASAEWPLWIWQVFHNWRQPGMSQRIFSVKAATLGCAEKLYAELQHQGLANDELVDVEKLANAVFERHWRSYPEKTVRSPGVVLSTIHKAKGLQYDKVLVVADDCKFAKEDLARLLYVAMTRAKIELRSITINKLCGDNKGYFVKGLKPYFFDSLNNFNARQSAELAEMLTVLIQAAGKLLPIFKVTLDDDKSWLCICDEDDRWHKLIRWYSRSVSDGILLTPSRWTTIAWPDDAPVYKKLLGPQLLLPLPVFTHGQ